MSSAEVVALVAAAATAAAASSSLSPVPAPGRFISIKSTDPLSEHNDGSVKCKVQAVATTSGSPVQLYDLSRPAAAPSSNCFSLFRITDLDLGPLAEQHQHTVVEISIACGLAAVVLEDKDIFSAAITLAQLRLYCLETCQCIAVAPLPRCGVHRIEANPQRPGVIAVCYQTLVPVEIYSHTTTTTSASSESTNTSGAIDTTAMQCEPLCPGTSIAWHPSGIFLAVAKQNSFSVFDTSDVGNVKCCCQFGNYYGTILAMTWSPDSRQLLVVSREPQSQQRISGRLVSFSVNCYTEEIAQLRLLDGIFVTHDLGFVCNDPVPHALGFESPIPLRFLAIDRIAMNVMGKILFRYKRAVCEAHQLYLLPSADVSGSSSADDDNDDFSRRRNGDAWDCDRSVFAAAAGGSDSSSCVLGRRGSELHVWLPNRKRFAFEAMLLREPTGISCFAAGQVQGSLSNGPRQVLLVSVLPLITAASHRQHRTDNNNIKKADEKKQRLVLYHFSAHEKFYASEIQVRGHVSKLSFQYGGLQVENDQNDISRIVMPMPTPEEEEED